MGSRTRRNRSRPIHPDVTAWVVKVNAAGDSVPASALVANREFVKRCYVGGFWQPKLRNGVVFTFATNTFSGILTPLANAPGVSPATSNFVSTDYSLTTGLVPNGNPSSSKRINLGAPPISILSSDDSAQLSFYSRTNQQTTSYPTLWACDGGGSSRFLIHAYSDPNTYFDCWSAVSPVDRVVASFSNSLGLITGSRTASNDSRIYQNGAQVGSTLTTVRTSTRPGGANFLNIFGDQNGGQEVRTCAYAYVGPGLTAAEESQHYTAVQQMQMRLNRAV